MRLFRLASLELLWGFMASKLHMAMQRPQPTHLIFSPHTMERPRSRVSATEISVFCTCQP